MRSAIADGLEVLDPAACRGWWIRQWHPEGPRCPHCSLPLEGRPAVTFLGGGRVRCNACRRWSTYRTGTPAHGSTIDDRALYLCALLSAAGLSRPRIARACRLSPDTVRVWQQRWAAA